MGVRRKGGEGWWGSGLYIDRGDGRRDDEMKPVVSRENDADVERMHLPKAATSSILIELMRWEMALR